MNEGCAQYTSFNLVDSLHKCMGNITYKAACTVQYSWRCT